MNDASLILIVVYYHVLTGPSWSWSFGSWIYNYLCNPCLSPLKFVSSNLALARCTSIQHYVIKFVSDFWQVSGFLRILRFVSTSKTYRHDITEILLKVALNTITLALTLDQVCVISRKICKIFDEICMISPTVCNVSHICMVFDHGCTISNYIMDVRYLIRSWMYDI